MKKFIYLTVLIMNYIFCADALKVKDIRTNSLYTIVVGRNMPIGKIRKRIAAQIIGSDKFMLMTSYGTILPKAYPLEKLPDDFDYSCDYLKLFATD